MSTTTQAISAYRTRYANGNAAGESAEPAAVEAGLAELVLHELRDQGLKDAYPRFDGGMPRAFGNDPPFWFTRPWDDTPARFEQVTLGGNPALSGPGGIVQIMLPLEGCIALGPSAGDPALLTVAARTWFFNLTWFFSLNRLLGGLVAESIGIENSAPLTGDIRWGTDWYCLRWPLPIYLTYIMPAAG